MALGTGTGTDIGTGHWHWALVLVLTLALAFGLQGGGEVGDQMFTEKECYEQAVQANPKLASGWHNLGSEGVSLPVTTSHYLCVSLSVCLTCLDGVSAVW